jgi:hypothetical protein
MGNKRDGTAAVNGTGRAARFFYLASLLPLSLLSPTSSISLSSGPLPLLIYILISQ